MATQRSKSPRSTRVVAPETPPTAAPPPTARRKTSAVREWLVISASGWSYLEEAGKHSIMRRTGLPARDLRVLDALLSYPSTILGRERAVVVSLEHIRAIVTATEVLIPNSKNPLVSSFVQDLKSRVSTAASPSQQGIGTSRSPSFPEFNESPKQSVEDPSHGRLTLQSLISNNDVQENSPRIKMDEARYEGANVLPFELRALEVCLESVCKFLEAETSLLEKEAYPALDELTSNISTLNLERVRQIKSRLVALSGRVQKVGDEIEHLLDDEMDMAEMYLTEKHLRKTAGGSSRFGTRDDEIELDGERDEREGDDERNNESALGFNPDIGELEMLLEAYFVHIDGTLRKLSALREYVDDTEDYLNIMLDDKQNQLLQMGVMLSTATLVTTAAIVVTGIFGMNIHIPLFETQGRFWKTVGCLLGGSVTLYISAIWWGRKSGLLQ